MKQLFTINQKNKLLRKIENLERKLNNFRRVNCMDLQEIRRLRDILDNHDINWKLERDIPIIEGKPFKKQEEKKE